MGLHGTGWIFKRGKRWWIGYRHLGVEYTESSGGEVRARATEKLQKRLTEIARGEFQPRSATTLKWPQLCQILRDDYVANRRRSTDRLEGSIKRLAEFFGQDTAAQITAARCAEYARYRGVEKAANGTINIELSSLRRMLKLAHRLGIVHAVPYIPRFRPGPPRQGFFTDAEVEAVITQLPHEIGAVVRFAYLTGWRKREVTGLRWSEVDWERGEIRLEAERTKGGEVRLLPFAKVPVLRQMLEHQRATARGLKGADAPPVTVFFWETSQRSKRAGEALRDFRDTWGRACIAAGCPGRLFHDLRRSAVRAMERAGVPRSQAMRITGHKTESVYKSYAIVSTDDLAEALNKRMKPAPKDDPENCQ